MKYIIPANAKALALGGNRLAAIRALRAANSPEMGLHEASTIVTSWLPIEPVAIATGEVVRAHRMAGDLYEELEKLADKLALTHTALSGSARVAGAQAKEILARLKTIIIDL